MKKVRDSSVFGVWDSPNIIEFKCHECSCLVQQNYMLDPLSRCYDCDKRNNTITPYIAKYQRVSCNLFLLKDIFESDDIVDSIGNWYDRLDFNQDLVIFREYTIKCLDLDIVEPTVPTICANSRAYWAQYPEILESDRLENQRRLSEALLRQSPDATGATFADAINGLKHQAKLVFFHKFSMGAPQPLIFYNFAIFHCTTEQNSYPVSIIEMFNQNMQYVSRSIVYSKNEHTFWENPFPIQVCKPMETFFNKMTTDIIEIHTATVVDNILPVEVVKIICHTYAQIMIWKCISS